MHNGVIENYAVLNDFPLFWDEELLAKNVHAPKFHRDMPSRFAVIPRRGGTDRIRWFEAESSRGEVSWISPVAKALLKAEEGDIVEVRKPKGVERLEILKISY